ncbi:MAG TPA: HAMP domain-containing sensor histidine kinase [Acidobacteriota bacterium]|nr:HAMP domain-containing sensor histidine kinase [Acidobacteriota bacterium]
MAAKRKIINRTSDLYIGKSTLFKTFLLVGVAAVSVVFIWYTFSVIDVLKQDTRRQVDLYVKLWQEVANSPTSSGELQVIFDEVILKASFPIVVCDSARVPHSWRNIPGVLPGDTALATRLKMEEVTQKMRADNGEYPLYITPEHVNYFYYGDSRVISQLTLMPFIEIGIVLAFLAVGIIGFQNIRRSEERYIWVGMAKETAHQLGTPISSLLGWLEVIGVENRSRMDSQAQQELIASTAENMQVDVERLQRVANRFGLIGSIPDLDPCDLNELVQEAVSYYRRRVPFKGKGIQIRFERGELPQVHANAELFGWALENLIKNSLEVVDSMSGRIVVATAAGSEGTDVCLEIKDNGPGIAAPAARKIFRPGFTTKKRGWGMGLTLVKRIIEEYHGGHIDLKRSKPGETVFEILLPVRNNAKG